MPPFPSPFSSPFPSPFPSPPYGNGPETGTLPSLSLSSSPSPSPTPKWGRDRDRDGNKTEVFYDQDMSPHLLLKVRQLKP